MGINQFSDMSPDEFKEFVSKTTPHIRKNVQVTQRMRDPDPNIDWTTKGMVTRVKDQGYCGS